MSSSEDLQSLISNIKVNYLDKKNYVTALKYLTDLLNKFNKNPQLYYYIGLCYANMNSLSKAEEYLRSIKTSKELTFIQLIQVNMLLGYIYTELNDLDNAEKCFKEAIRINPDSSNSYSALGYVYYLQKRYDQAILNFKKAIDKDPDNASAHNNLGYTFAEIGININEAINECKKAVSLIPDSAVYRDSLAWAYYVAGKYDLALKEIKTALDLPCSKKEIIKDHYDKILKKINIKTK